MIIDFHAHLEYKNSNEKYSADEFIAGMDTGGIDVTCLYGNDQGDPGECPRWQDGKRMSVPTNFFDEELFEFCNHYPKRLIGITSINPNRYQPKEKIERAITEFGMRGVKIYPHSGFYPNDHRLWLTYQLCSDMNVPVIFHTGPKAVSWQWMKYNRPIFIDEIATNFPDLKIVLCHGGYPWVEEFIAVVYTNPNIWVDLTFMDRIEESFRVPNYVRNLVERLIQIIGPQRLLWGSEGPYMDLPLYGQQDPSYYQISQNKLVKQFEFISDDDKLDILGNNAARLLKINLSDE